MSIKLQYSRKLYIIKLQTSQTLNGGFLLMYFRWTKKATRARRPHNAIQPNTAPTIEYTELEGSTGSGLVGRGGGGSVSGGA